MSLDITVNQLASLGVHGNGARDKDHAIGLDGLAVDARERLGSLVSEDSNLGSHCDVLRVLMGWNWGKEL